MRHFTVFAVLLKLWAGLAITACSPQAATLADEPVTMSFCDAAVNSCDLVPRGGKRLGGRLCRTPAMIGDFFAGTSLDLQGNSKLDSLMVWANDLDAPLLLPRLVRRLPYLKQVR